MVVRCTKQSVSQIVIGGDIFQKDKCKPGGILTSYTFMLKKITGTEYAERTIIPP